MNKNLLIQNIFNISFFKTLYVNFKLFSFTDAIRLPILIARNTKLKSIKATFTFPSNIYPGMIKIGFSKIFGLGITTVLDFKRDSRVVFEGKCFIGAGSHIEVFENASLVLGSGVSIGSNNKILCSESINIGQGSFTSWDCTFIDTDIHKIMIQDIHNNINLPVIIGENCWICCNVIVLKGSKISSGSVVAAGSLVNSEFNKSIIAGSPAKEVYSESFEIIR